MFGGRTDPDRGSIQTAEDQYAAWLGWAGHWSPPTYSLAHPHVGLIVGHITHPLIDCFVQYPSRQPPWRLSKTQERLSPANQLSITVAFRLTLVLSGAKKTTFLNV